jgi:hypothetical protein
LSVTRWSKHDACCSILMDKGASWNGIEKARSRLRFHLHVNDKNKDEPSPGNSFASCLARPPRCFVCQVCTSHRTLDLHSICLELIGRHRGSALVVETK